MKKTEFGRILWHGLNNNWINYKTEIDFCKEYNFSCMQITYKDGKLQCDGLPEPKEKTIVEAGFPVVIHAIFDTGDYEKYSDDLLKVLINLNQNEVIIHPTCEPSIIDRSTIHELSGHNKKITDKYFNEGITVYIENCARIVPLNYTADDLKMVFNDSPKTEFVLDVSHIDNYDHLGDLINVKYPKMLHIADKRFSIGHEHLPIGSGEMGFELIFGKYLSDFNGKIFFEISEDENTIIDSLNKLKKAMSAQTQFFKQEISSARVFEASPGKKTVFGFL